MSFFVFFFKDTATTEIYTYLHTHPLHDALPISARMADRQKRAGAALFRIAAAIGRRGGIHDRFCPRIRTHSVKRLQITLIEPGQFRWRRFGRSEEHTSELQSLMRISYAVFCLKKKKNIRSTINRQDYKSS